jgi:hypothetical protein
MRAPVVVLLLLLASPLHAVCVGDCDGDGRVGVAEVVGLVDCSLLPRLPLPCGRCSGLSDGESLSIARLIMAVNNALVGCPPAACRRDADCTAGGARCVPPGGSPGCGVCRDDPDECAGDDQCPRDFVCAPTPEPPCPCDGTPARICVRRCVSDTACESRQRCRGGRCVRDSCVADADCPDLGTCVLGACYDAPGTCQLPPP